MKFCLECGLELEVCTECREINAWFADFCHNCGKRMAVEVNIARPEPEKVVYPSEQNLCSLDEALLAIIKLRDGSISLSEISKLLGIPRESLTQSIERLQHSHLIEKTS